MQEDVLRCCDCALITGDEAGIASGTLCGVIVDVDAAYDCTFEEYEGVVDFSNELFTACAFVALEADTVVRAIGGGMDNCSCLILGGCDGATILIRHY